MSNDTEQSIHGKNTDEAVPKLKKKLRLSLWKSLSAVTFARFFLATVLFSSATILGYFTYRICATGEQQDFENQFASMSNELIENSQAKVQRVFGDLESMSLATTSQILHQNASSWPFVTIPDFEIRAEKLRNTSKALVVAFNPLVENEERQAWEQYAVDNQDWLLEAYHGMADPVPINDKIWGYEDEKSRNLQEGSCSARRRLSSKDKVREIEPEGSGPFVPVWHLSPLPPANDTSILNYNMFDKPVMKKAAELINYTRKSVILDVCTQTLWFGSTMPHEEGELQTVVVAPVFADFTEKSPIVGYYIAVFLWKDFFEHILHPKSSEMVFVLSNTCDEVFTHTVTGVNVELVGEIDAHDPNFSSKRVSSTFADFSNSKKLLEEGLGKHCVYTIDVYPTESMRNDFITNKPLWYMLVVLTAFFLTSIIFVLYDVLVRQQEQRIVKSAEKHEQLVSSLFPEDVRKQVLEIADQQKQDRLTAGEGVSILASTVKSDENAINPTINVFGSKPIANVYQNTTVYFADIAGFTAWSSSRDATDVFTLLEGVYHSFDVIASNHSIFKVETIGDCYVSVSGLPSPDPKHAVNMARFAQECLGKFQHLMTIFKFVLGDDTGDLALRCGLHSGPVTAGVLRGEKSRFQLFGDTVNTASRMETTGLPDRIQISEETASELRKNGCHAWFVPREDEITAKGKGSLRTYWLGVGNPENIVIKEEANTTDLSDGDLTDISEGSNSPPKPKDSSSSKHYRNWVLSEFDNVSC